MSDQVVIVDVPMPPRSWFSIDWTVAADKWVAIYPERTLEMWCNLPHEWRCEWAEAECAQRRARGVPDPDEPTPDWALKSLNGQEGIVVARRVCGAPAPTPIGATGAPVTCVREPHGDGWHNDGTPYPFTFSWREPDGVRIEDPGPSRYDADPTESEE